MAELRLTAVKLQINILFGQLEMNHQGTFGWLDRDHLSAIRLDSWFNQPKYVAAADCLNNRHDLIKVHKLCRLVSRLVNWSRWRSKDFEYFEIGGIDEQPGTITPTVVAVAAAPSRAKYLVQGGDILVSTVRPNLKGVALVSGDCQEAVCSSGFSVLRADTREATAYVWACLIHDLATFQMTRWNTGGTYPAIDRSVPLEVRVPNPGEERILDFGDQVLCAICWSSESEKLVERAKADVEALISGALNTEALLVEGAAIEDWLTANPIPHNNQD